jgi:hypothetical protein
VPYRTKSAYSAADYWKDFRLIVEIIPPSPNITFADANVKAICVGNWDLNDDGELSEAEAGTVTDLGIAFRNNTMITSFDELRYFTWITSIGEFAFRDCSNLSSIIIPNNVKSIVGFAFYGCTSLTSITIPNSVTSIGNNAFSGCIGLTSVTIPNSVISIGDAAFYGCSGLASVTIPNSVTSIGESAFQYCTNLISVTIPKSVTSIGTSTFGMCTGLISVTIPNSVTSIGDGAFSTCGSLTSITIGNSVTNIGNSAFERCSSLTSVTIGNGLKTIGSKAFASCSDLTDVYCHAEDVPSTQSDAFSDSNIESATLHVPTASIDAYKATAPWSGFKTIVGFQKCATPTISLVGGKLHFECETEDVEYHYEFTTPASGNGTGNNVAISSTYVVSVYASKEGYTDSDVATADVNVAGLKGDANSDGEVDIADAVHIVNYVVGKIDQLAPRKDNSPADPE